MARLRPILLALLFLTGCVPLAESAVVRITVAGRGMGTGFVVHRDGNRCIALTAAHVVQRGSMAITADGYDARVLVVRSDWDIAAIEFQADRPYHVLGFDKPRRGQEAHLVGFASFDPNASRPYWWYGRVGYVDDEKVMVNAGAVGGLSGGPVVDAWGRVIGMVSYSPGRFHSVYDATVLCVPAARLKEVADGLR